MVHSLRNLTATRACQSKVNLITLKYLGLIISGGWNKQTDSVCTSVELFVPSTFQLCQLPNLSVCRRRHTMDAMLVCGGMGDPGVETSCQTFSKETKTWEKTTDLREQRFHTIKKLYV